MINWIKNSNNIAVIYQNKKYKYSHILKYIYKAQQYLNKSSIKRNDRVILFGENSIEFIILIFALNKIGAIFVILDTKMNNKRLEYIFNDILAKTVIIDNQLYAQKQNIINKNFKNPIITEKFLSDIMKVDEEIKTTYEIDKNNIATIIYTSGSTGNPKGVISLNKNIIFSVEKINQRLNYKKNDTVLSGLNFSFDYGLYQIFLVFNIEATLILEKNLDNILNIPAILHKYEVTIFPIVPTIIDTLLISRLLERIELPYLEKITSTGEVLQVSTIKKIQKLFPNTTIFPMYGITECKRVAIMPEAMLNKKLGSVGKALDDIDINLNKDGELLVSGQNVMFGYWNEKKISKNGTYFSNIDGQKVLHTGDYFKQDSDGYLYFLGRKDDIVKINSKRINLKEIESYFIEKYYSIGEIGVKYSKDNLYIYIFGNINIKTILLDLKNDFYIKGKKENIFIQDTPLPKNSNGKIDKNGLLKQYI